MEATPDARSEGGSGPNAMRVLNDVDDATFASFVDALSKIDRSARRSRIVATLVSEAGMAESDAIALFDLAIDTARIHFSSSRDVAPIATSVAEQFGGTATAAARLTSLAEADPVRFIAKALDVLTEYRHLYLSSRVLTDVRPVFIDDVSKPPSGFTVSQTLRIEALDSGNPSTIYITLDDVDLKSLQTQLHRAQQKMATIVSELKAADQTVFLMGGADASADQ